MTASINHREEAEFGEGATVLVASAFGRDWVADFLNRRTEVEHELRAFAAGKRGPISQDEARALANRLSIPTDPDFGRRSR